MSRLCELSKKHGSDKVQFGYTTVYHLLFQSLMDKPVKLLEIGVLNGSSMRMWEEYFPKGEIHGADIKPKNTPAGHRYQVHQCDQSSREQLAVLVKKAGGNFDIVVDDGSHQTPHMMLSFDILMPHVKPGGIYIIEDVANRQISLEKGKLHGTKEKDFSDSVISTFERLQSDGVLASPYMENAAEIQKTIDFFQIYYAQQPPITRAGTSDLIIVGKSTT